MHSGLIVLFAEFLNGTKSFKRFIRKQSDQLAIIKASSVKKRFLTSGREDLNSQLIVVLKYESQLDLENLVSGLKSDQSERTRIRAALLTFDQVTKLSPVCPLPHPLLHSDPLILRLAAEIWPTWEHPILKMTLAEALKDQAKAVQEELGTVEFHSQGFHLMQEDSD